MPIRIIWPDGDSVTVVRDVEGQVRRALLGEASEPLSASDLYELIDRALDQGAAVEPG